MAYPAGFPILLALVFACFGTSELAIQVLMTLIWAGTVAGLAYLFRYELPPRYVYGLVLVIGLHSYIWFLKHRPLADLPFLLCVVLSLLWYERSVRAERDGAGSRWGWALLAGTAAAYATATRPLGLILVPVFLLYDLARVRRPTRLLFAVAVSYVVLFGAYIGLVDLEAGARVAVSGGGIQEGEAAEAGGYGALFRLGFLRHLGDLPRHVVDRLWDYARYSYVFWHVPQPGGAVLKNILLGLSLVPIGIAAKHRLPRFGLVESFCLLYGLSLLPWSFSWMRYMAPLIPFYYFYLFVGLKQMHLARPTAGWPARIATVLMVGGLVAVYALQYANNFFNDRSHMSFGEIAQNAVYVYLREETAPATVVITEGDPRRHVFYTRRAASAAPRDIDRWASYADLVGASYALARRGADVTLQLPADRFSLVDSSGSYVLYHILPANPLVTEQDKKAETVVGE